MEGIAKEALDAVAWARAFLRPYFPPRSNDTEGAENYYYDPFEDVGCRSVSNWVLVRAITSERWRSKICLSIWDLGSFLCSCAVLISIYLLARKYVYSTPKQRCWILTCVNSLVTPLLSFRSLFRIVNNKWEYVFVVGGSRSSRFCTLFFMAYLVCELIVGSLDYRKQVSLIMGYVHHVSYLLLSLHLLVENRTNILAMSLLEELPTLILAVGRLGSAYLNSFDYAFGLSFVVTRIVFHLYVQYNMFLWRKDAKLGWYWQVCTLSFGMNVHWLLAWWKSVKRRRLKYGGAQLGSKLKHRSYNRKSHRYKVWPTMGRIMAKSYQRTKHSGKRIGNKMRTSLFAYRQRLKSQIPIRVTLSDLQSSRRRMEVNIKEFARSKIRRIGSVNRRMMERGKRMSQIVTDKFVRDQRDKVKRE